MPKRWVRCDRDVVPTGECLPVGVHYITGGFLEAAFNLAKARSTRRRSNHQAITGNKTMEPGVSRTIRYGLKDAICRR